MIRKGNCDICGIEIDIEICCDGYMCGCQGLPIYKPVCSEECDKQWDINNISKPKSKIIETDLSEFI